MTLTETTLTGGAQTTMARRVRKWAKATGNSTATEQAIMVCKVIDLRQKTFSYQNRSTKTHTIKIYHCPDRTKPAAITDANVKVIWDGTVGPAAMSDPLVLENDYHWLILTQSGDAETDVWSAYFEGTTE